MKALELELPAEIKRLEILVKTLVTSKFIGNYRSVFRGRGLEFESYREYTPEDDSRLIDWKASARTNKVLIKELKEERNLDVTFLLDTSSKMLFGSTDKLKSQYATELIASLAYAILKANDNVSLITFNDKNIKIIPLANGEKQFYKIAKVLLDNNNYGNSFNLKDALNFALYNAKKESLLVIVSDFINPGKDWQYLLKVASQKFDVIALMIRDPRDRELPENYKITLESPETGRRIIVDTSVIKDKYSKYVNEEEEYVKQEFIKASSDFAEIITDKPFLEPLIELFGRRKKKWR